MAGELGEAIGLQGRPRTTTAKELFFTGLQLDQAKEQEKARKAQAAKQEDDAFNKQINDAIKIKYEDYHRTDLPVARDLVANNIKRLVEMKASGNPAWKNEAPNMFNELNFQLGKLRQASNSKFEFEKYANQGGYTDDAARKYYNYLRTNNPGYLKGIDLSRSTVINAIDPESGAAAFTPLQPLDVNAYIRQNIYDPFKKEQYLGTENGFDRIGNAFDPQIITATALEQFAANPQLRANFEAQNKADILNEMDKGYWKGKINQYTFKDPSFQQDYEEALQNKFVDYVASQQPVEEKLSRTPKGQTTNIFNNMGGDGSTDSIFSSEGAHVSFTDTGGNKKTAIAGKSYTMAPQEVILPAGTDLIDVDSGYNAAGKSISSQRMSSSGAQKGTVTGIIPVMVYDEGTVIKGEDGKEYDYSGTLVGQEDIESGRAKPYKYHYKPVALIKIGGKTYYGDANRVTGASRYLSASEKEKPVIVKIMEDAQKDAETRNKSLKSAAPKTTSEPGKKKVISGF